MDRLGLQVVTEGVGYVTPHAEGACRMLGLRVRQNAHFPLSLAGNGRQFADLLSWQIQEDSRPVGGYATLAPVQANEPPVLRELGKRLEVQRGVNLLQARQGGVPGGD